MHQRAGLDLRARARAAVERSRDVNAKARRQALERDRGAACDRAVELREQAEALRASRPLRRNLLSELQLTVTQLTGALTSRAVIEQAKGILIAREGCTPDVAFDMLRRASQRENRKLGLIAADIVARAQHGNQTSSSAPRPTK
jgi:hypothetical protein